MKLELKHVAPYLPYGLQCQTKDRGKKVISTLNACYSDNSYTFMGIVESEKGFSDVKPLLRPLEDLTKEIEHNGEEFVPLKRMGWIDYPGSNMDVDIFILDIKNGSAQYMEMKKLFQWHFDVFDLIPNNLAIDKNKI